MSLEVYKFGGVAMGTPDAIRAAVARVAAARAAPTRATAARIASGVPMATPPNL
jgi:hypothetical protein